MGPVAGEGGLIPRLFLVAPEAPAPDILACLAAACATGDVASLLVPASLAGAITSAAQARGVAVLCRDEAREAARAGCDGVQVTADVDAVHVARAALGRDRIVGALAGVSRHAAMEAAEAGADYVAFCQSRPAPGGEPVIRWWSDLMEVPCVAHDPVTADDLDTLLPQKPDFIRPSDAMWESPERARAIVAALSGRLKT